MNLIDRLGIINSCLSDIMKILITNKKQDVSFNYALIDLKESINMLEKATFEFTSNTKID